MLYFEDLYFKVHYNFQMIIIYDALLDIRSYLQSFISLFCEFISPGEKSFGVELIGTLPKQ